MNGKKLLSYDISNFYLRRATIACKIPKGPDEFAQVACTSAYFAISRFCQDAIALITNENQADSFTRAAKIHKCVAAHVEAGCATRENAADWFR